MTNRWIKVPLEILFDKILSSTSRMVWAYLRYRQGANATAWPSLETIGQDLGLSKTGAGRAVRELESARWIEVNRPDMKGRGHHLVYRLKPLSGDETNGPQAGLLGEGKGSQVDPSDQRKGPKSNDKRSACGKELDTVNKSRRTQTAFIPPTVDDLREYATSIGYPTLDAEHFIRYYSADDWRLANGKPMRSWRRAVLTWQNRDQVAIGSHKLSSSLEASPNDQTWDPTPEEAEALLGGGKP